MEIRFHHRRLAWIVAATALGVAGCAAGKGETPAGGGKTQPGATHPGKPSGAKPGGTVGSTAPGTPKHKPGHRHPRRVAAPGGEVCPPGSQKPPKRTSEIGRPRIVDAICSDILTSGDELGTDQNLSDAQIVSILAAIDQSDIAAATVAAQRARDARLQGLAELELASHARAGEAQARLAHSGAAAQDSALRRLVIDRGGADLTALQRSVGSELDRQYLCRQIGAHERELRVLSAVAAQVKDADVRCAVEEQRVLDGGHLDFAYWLLTSMVEGRGRGYAGFGHGKAQGINAKADDDVADDEDDDDDVTEDQ